MDTNTKRMAVHIYMTGLVAFEHAFENNPGNQFLAQIFCLAARDVFLAEVEGAPVNLTEILIGVHNRIQRPIPPEVVKGLNWLDPKEFGEWLGPLYTRAVKEGVVLAELAEALTSARQLATEFAHQQDAPSKHVDSR